MKFKLLIFFFIIFSLFAFNVFAHGEFEQEQGRLIDFLVDNHNLILLLHIVGIILGVGGATVTDILFFKFLKDFRISRKEEIILGKVSKIIWVGLATLIITGLGLYLPQAEILNQSSIFLIKMVVVAVILVNGIVLNIFISPRLRSINFRRELKEKKLRFWRRFSFASGAISISSWYIALILGLLIEVSMAFFVMLLAYIGIIFLAVIISQIAESYLCNR